MKTYTLKEKRRILCSLAVMAALESEDIYDTFWYGHPGYEDYPEDEVKKEWDDITTDMTEEEIEQLADRT